MILPISSRSHAPAWECIPNNQLEQSFWTINNLLAWIARLATDFS